MSGKTAISIAVKSLSSSVRTMNPLTTSAYTIVNNLANKVQGDQLYMTVFSNHPPINGKKPWVTLGTGIVIFARLSGRFKSSHDSFKSYLCELPKAL